MLLLYRLDIEREKSSPCCNKLLVRFRVYFLYYIRWNVVRNLDTHFVKLKGWMDGGRRENCLFSWTMLLLLLLLVLLVFDGPREEQEEHEEIFLAFGEG